jgi:putative transposase
MSGTRAAVRVREIYKFIEQHQKEYGVQAMCRVLGVARSGYCEWLRGRYPNVAKRTLGCSA